MLTTLGIIGEAPKLEPEELLGIVNGVIGRTKLPVVVSVSAPGFAAMHSLALQSMTDARSMRSALGCCVTGTASGRQRGRSR